MTNQRSGKWHGFVTKPSSAMRGVILLAACTLAVLGCGQDLVTIRYSQPANAYIFDKDPTAIPHQTVGAGNGIFAFYCINAIENGDTNARDFQFDLFKVFASGDPADNPGNTSFASLVQTAPAMLTVAAQSSSPALGRIVINVSNGLDPDNPGAMHDLGYASAGEESVIMVRDGGKNAPPVQFLDPASPVHPNNLPVCP